MEWLSEKQYSGNKNKEKKESLLNLSVTFSKQQKNDNIFYTMIFSGDLLSIFKENRKSYLRIGIDEENGKLVFQLNQNEGLILTNAKGTYKQVVGVKTLFRYLVERNILFEIGKLQLVQEDPDTFSYCYKEKT